MLESSDNTWKKSQNNEIKKLSKKKKRKYQSEAYEIFFPRLPSLIKSNNFNQIISMPKNIVDMLVKDSELSYCESWPTLKADVLFIFARNMFQPNHSLQSCRE